jgi:hypothetical protein
MKYFSTKDLTGFYEIEELRRITKILAVLEAVMESDESLRYHHFHSEWDKEKQEQLAEVNDGSGNDMYILFSPAGVVIKGFDHESGMSRHARDDFDIFPGIYDDLPAVFSNQLEDPAFEKDDVTFCLWRGASDKHWHTGKVQIPDDDDDGSGFLLNTLHASAEDYCDWAEDYYEREIPFEIVEQIYQDLKVDEQTARKLNPEVDYSEVEAEIKEILS